MKLNISIILALLLISCRVNDKKNQIIQNKEFSGDITYKKNQNTNSATQIIDTQLFSVKSSFKKMNAPYGGHVTKHITCDTEKYLKEVPFIYQGKETKVIFAVATARKLFGGCAKQQIKHAALFWAAYDKKTRKVIIIRLFKPLKEIDQIEIFQNQLFDEMKNILRE